MKSRFSQTSALFLILVFIQAAHSIEEYIGRLWENLPPATYVTGLISKNHETGFLIINIGMFALGLLLWAFVVHPNKPAAGFVLWIWIVIEVINGIGHPVWAIMQGGYEPGVVTAPFLLIVALMLIYRQTKAKAY